MLEWTLLVVRPTSYVLFYLLTFYPQETFLFLITTYNVALIYIFFCETVLCFFKLNLGKFVVILHRYLLVDVENGIYTNYITFYNIVVFCINMYNSLTSYYRWGVLDTTLCDKVCQGLVACRWFFPATPVSSINKADRLTPISRLSNKMNRVQH
jgi:hypothetical protein